MIPALATAVPAPPRQPTPRRVLLADAEAARGAPLERCLADLVSTSVVRVETRPQLEQALQAGDFDLVVTASRLGPESALQSLARVRSGGDQTPFIVYSALHASLMRVLVSDTEGALLSSRVVHLSDLLETASALIERRGAQR
jgi:DNA-binding response OmpR family regulator